MLIGKPEFKPIEHFEKVRRGKARKVSSKMLAHINNEFVKGFEILRKYKKAGNITI